MQMGFAAFGVLGLLLLLLRGKKPAAHVAAPTMIFWVGPGKPVLDGPTFQKQAGEALDRARRGEANERELLRLISAAGRFGYDATERVLMMSLERVQRGAYPPALRTLVDRALAEPPPSLLDLQATERALQIAGFPATAISVRDVRRDVEAGHA